MNRGLSLVLVLLVVLILAACAQATPEPVTFQVEMSEFAFTPDTFSVKVGQMVTFELINVGQLEHEMMFGREVEKENNRPHGFHTDMFAFAGIEPTVSMMNEMPMEEEPEHGHEGFMVSLPKGSETVTLTFAVTEEMVGEWEIGCFLQDGVHYDAGMHGSLTVTR